MQIERHEIRVFSAVVEEGGFSRAAERLNVSQSAVSQTIANLEHKLDARLIVRGGKPELTEAGKRLFNFTQMVIKQELDALMAAARQELQGLTLLTAYLDDVTKRPGSERLMNQFASVWEVSHLELRLALAEAGKGVTYLSDRLLAELDGYHPIGGLEISTIARVVGVFHKKHQALSEAAKRFLAICQNHFAESQA